MGYIANIKGNIALCLGYSGESGNFIEEILLSELQLKKGRSDAMETTKTAPFKVGDRVCCEDRPGETLEVVKLNRFDDDWAWCRCEWWPSRWKPDLFHVSQLGLITQQTFDSDTFQKPVV